MPASPSSPPPAPPSRPGPAQHCGRLSPPEPAPAREPRTEKGLEEWGPMGMGGLSPWGPA